MSERPRRVAAVFCEIGLSYDGTEEQLETLYEMVDIACRAHPRRADFEETRAWLLSVADSRGLKLD